MWASDRMPGDQLGYSVGASGRYVVAGAPNSDGADSPAGRGAGYVWELRRTVPSEPAPTASSEQLELTVYPNPFRERLAAAVMLERPQLVMLEVVDVLGRVVARRELGRLTAGRHEVALGGGAWGAGTYLVRVTAGAQSVTERITLVR